MSSPNAPNALRPDTMLTLQQALALLPPGAQLVGDGNLPFARVHSDTRSLRPGDLFVALRGERFDAHDFLAQAGQAGAVAALAERGLGAQSQSTLPGLQVPDSLLALQQLASAWRGRHHLPLVAVTGSNGKTTVTQMVASILRAAFGEAAFSTQGNLNNHIGVPLTLLRLRAQHRAGVVELGMNHPGEINELAAMARPTIALVNNAQREHLEFMATVEAVARENGSVLGHLPPNGTAVFPADDAYTALWRELAGARRVLSFALQGPADVTGEASWQSTGWVITLNTPAGRTTATLAQAGQHNVKNALAATACALAAGVPLAAVSEGLTDFKPVNGRSQAQRLRLNGRDITLVNDTYNANPDSMLAAVDVLSALPGPRWLVLGDMGEVGDRGAEFHTEIGHAARQRGIEVLWTAGPLSAHVRADRHFHDTAALVAALHQAPAAASVLVKGSRFMKMEQVVQALQALHQGAPAAQGQA